MGGCVWKIRWVKGERIDRWIYYIWIEIIGLVDLYWSSYRVWKINMDVGFT
jgi:hypothetical protein